MSAPEFDPELVEQAAQAVSDAFYAMQGGDPTWPEAPKFTAGDMDIALAVLRVVADDLRAEGVTRKHGPCICNTGPGTEGPDEYCPHHGHGYTDLLAYGDTAYRRGRVDGARQVLTATNEAAAKAGVDIVIAAREAVARIEKGGAR